MKTTKHNDHYLLENDKGSYHISIEKYDSLGKEKAEKLAQEEIEKKLQNKQYSQATIDFSRARELGFCEYGIEDFAERLGLDVNKEYTIKELSERLTAEVFLKYSYECRKLFGNNVLYLFGGEKSFLENNQTRQALDYILNYGNLPDKVLHELACDFAERVLVNFEKEFPEDKRPRLAIEAKRKFIKGEISNDDLTAARSAAWSAAGSAAWSAGSAAWSARSAASSARSAASPAACSAAWSARSAVSLVAETQAQIKIVLKYLK